MSEKAKRIERRRQLYHRAYQLACDFVAAYDTGLEPEQLGTIYDEAASIRDEWDRVEAEMKAAALEALLELEAASDNG